MSSLTQDYQKNKTTINNNVTVQTAIDVLEKIRLLLVSGDKSTPQKQELSKYYDLLLQTDDIRNIMSKLGHYQVNDIDETGKETFKVFDYASVLNLPQMLEGFRDFIIGEDMFLIDTYNKVSDNEARYQRIKESSDKLKTSIDIVNSVIEILTNIQSSLKLPQSTVMYQVQTNACDANKFLQISSKPENEEVMKLRQDLAKITPQLEMILQMKDKTNKSIDLSTPEIRQNAQKELRDKVMQAQVQIETLLCQFGLRPNEEAFIDANIIFLKKLHIISKQLKSVHVSRSKSSDTIQLSLRELIKSVHNTVSVLTGEQKLTQLRQRQESKIPNKPVEQLACHLSDGVPYVEEEDDTPIQSLTEMANLLKQKLKITENTIPLNASIEHIRLFFTEIDRTVSAWLNKSVNVDKTVKSELESALTAIRSALKSTPHNLTIGSVSKLVYFLGGDQMLGLRSALSKYSNIDKDFGNVLLDIINKELIKNGIDNIKDYDDEKKKTKLRNKNYLNYTTNDVNVELADYIKLKKQIVQLRKMIQDDQERLAILENYDNIIKQRDDMQKRLTELGADQKTDTALLEKLKQSMMSDLDKLRNVLDKTITTTISIEKIYANIPFISREQVFDIKQIESARQKMIMVGGYKLENFVQQLESNNELSSAIRTIYMDYVTISTLFKSRFTRMYNLINIVSDNMINTLVYNICKLELFVNLCNENSSTKIAQYIKVDDLIKMNKRLPNLLNERFNTSPYVMLKMKLLSSLSGLVEKILQSKPEECINITNLPNSVDISLCIYFHSISK